MEEKIYKVAHMIGKNKMKSLYVFIGPALFSKKTEAPLEQLFKQNPNKDLFRKNLPAADLNYLIAMKQQGVTIQFIKERLHLDDTIETIKKKIIRHTKLNPQFFKQYWGDRNFTSQDKKSNAAVW